MQHIVDLFAEKLCRLVGPHDQNRGIVAGQRAHQILDLHPVYGGARRRSQARHGLDDYNILRHVERGDALFENTEE